MPPTIEQEITTALAQGAVFYFVERTLTTNSPHYFVLLNKAPVPQDDLVFVFAVSDVAGRSDRRLKLDLTTDRATLVVATSADYTELSRESLFDCSSHVRKTLADLVLLGRERRLQIKTPIPQPLLNKLVAGAMVSKLMPDELKKKITPPPTP